MKTSHLERIRCVRCGGRLTVPSGADYVEDGIIECADCSARFPVIRSVPRLLEGEMLANCLLFYGEVVALNRELAALDGDEVRDAGRAGTGCAEAEKLKAKTQKSFTYEWNIWKTMPEFAMNHFLEVMQVEEKFFDGKSGWDPAVGIGRDCANALKAVGDGGFMIGSDISYAVDIAYDMCGAAPNALIVQADLYSPFVPDESLDFAYMIGLIQHLTARKKA